MNPVKFSDATGEIEGFVWVCGKCKHACHNERQAKECCDARCSACGEPADRPWLKCGKCRNADDVRNTRLRYDRAPKLSLKEYDHEYVVFDGDETGTTVEEWLDMPEDERPEWAWAVSNIGLTKIDARDAVCLDDFHEDAHEDLDFDSLQTVLDAWVDKQNQDLTWYQQVERIVLFGDVSDG